MADIQVLFAAQNPSGDEFINLADNTFFEYKGELYYKVDDSLALKVTSSGIEAVTIDDFNDDELDYDTQVVRAPAGVGFTLMQSAA